LLLLFKYIFAETTYQHKLENTKYIQQVICRIIMSSILASKINDPYELAEFFKGSITSDYMEDAKDEKLIIFESQVPVILPPMSCDCENSW
jgi:hypothetical protein